MWEFLEQWFIRPIYTGEGYNIFNTAVYVALFVLGMYGARGLMKKWGVPIGKGLFSALIPYFVFAGLLRALQDYHPVKHWLFITPGIYLLMAALVAGIILLSKRDLGRVRSVGWVLSASCAGLVVAAAHSHAFQLGWAIAISGAAVGLTFLLWKAFPKILKSRENRVVMLSQVLDGAATAISIKFLGYFEQHIVSAWIVGADPFLFLAVKIAVSLGALHYIDREKGRWNWLLKAAIAMLGLAPGIRSLARVFMGV